MNIWILNHYATTPDMPGGSRHYDLGKELVKKGYNITIFASSFNHASRKEEKLKGKEIYRRENYNGVSFIWIRTFPYLKNDWRRIINWFSYTLRIIKIGIKIKENPQVIIGSSVHPFAVLAAYILSRIKSSRFFFEVRDPWPQTLIYIGSISKNHILMIFFHLLEKFLYKRAEKIITLLPKSGDYITDLGIPKDKIVRIPNGVDMSYFNNHPIRRKNPTRFTFMYLGSHAKGDVLDVIIDAAKVIKEKGIDRLFFTFVGDGPEKKALIRQSKHLNLDNIEFKDPVPKQLIPEIMLEADAFMVTLENSPLYKYGISFNKIYDYMAGARPIIFAGNSVNNPIDEASAGITVRPRNPEALADAFIKLSSLSSKERSEMGKRGRLYVEEKHDIRKLAEKLIKIIE